MKHFKAISPNVFWIINLGFWLILSSWQPAISYGRSLDSMVVMDWQGSGINQKLAAHLRGVVYSNLQASGRYTVLKPEQAIQLLRKKGVPELADCKKSKCLNELGQALVVDKVFLGKINKAGSNYKITFKIFNVVRKEIIARAEQTIAFPSEQFNDKAEELTRKLLKKVPVQGKVVAVSEGRLTLDVGSNVGLRKGKRLRVIRLKEVRAGRRLLYMGEKLVGDIKLVWVGENQSEATIEKSHVTVKQGDIVDIKDYLLFSKPKQKKEPVVATGTPVIIAPVEQKVEPKDKPEPEKVPDMTIGTLTITTNPTKAEIVLDGESIGYTPKTIPNLKIGIHNIKLSKRAYRNWAGKIDVKPSQENSVKVNLVAYGGKLNISSVPTGATIIVGKRSWGKTNRTLKFTPGSYLVKLNKKGYRSKSQRVKVKDGESTNLSMTLVQDGVSKVSGMLYVPEGSFTMGTNKKEADEGPAHRVHVAAFYIDKAEVNYKKYQKFLTATGRRYPDFWDDTDLNKPDLPVVGISWEDSKAYCKWAGKRLPTEAEWEKAARGTNSKIYPWGNTFDSKRANAFGEKDGFQFTAPVSSFTSGASLFGALNMAGNVWEWCADWYAEDYYNNSPSKSPKGPDQGQLRVIRGGSWEDGADNLRTTNRHAARPRNTAYNIGFRCAK